MSWEDLEKDVRDRFSVLQGCLRSTSIILPGQRRWAREQLKQAIEYQDMVNQHGKGFLTYAELLERVTIWAVELDYRLAWMARVRAGIAFVGALSVLLMVEFAFSLISIGNIVGMIFKKVPQDAAASGISAFVISIFIYWSLLRFAQSVAYKHQAFVARVWFVLAVILSGSILYLSITFTDFRGGFSINVSLDSSVFSALCGILFAAFLHKVGLLGDGIAWLIGKIRTKAPAVIIQDRRDPPPL